MVDVWRVVQFIQYAIALALIIDYKSDGDIDLWHMKYRLDKDRRVSRFLDWLIGKKENSKE